MEYYEFKEIIIDDLNRKSEPDIHDCIELRGDHDNLLISYYDVDRVIKALRQGKREINKYYRHKARKEQTHNDR